MYMYILNGISRKFQHFVVFLNDFYQGSGLQSPNTGQKTQHPFAGQNTAHLSESFRFFPQISVVFPFHLCFEFAQCNVSFTCVKLNESLNKIKVITTKWINHNFDVQELQVYYMSGSSSWNRFQLSPIYVASFSSF